MKKAQPQDPGANDTPLAKPQQDEEKVTVSASALKEMLLQLATLSEQVKTAGKPQRKPHFEADLPDQSTIDPSRIKFAVQTKQGWVVPNA